jgi:hypothetical protein
MERSSDYGVELLLTCGLLGFIARLLSRPGRERAVGSCVRVSCRVS